MLKREPWHAAHHNSRDDDFLCLQSIIGLAVPRHSSTITTLHVRERSYSAKGIAVILL